MTDPTVDSRIAAGAQLVVFTDALLSGDGPEIARARDRLAGAVGPATAAAAAGVIANFQMMNRILDATGVATPPGRLELARELGVDPATFGGAHGT